MTDTVSAGLRSGCVALLAAALLTPVGGLRAQAGNDILERGPTESIDSVSLELVVHVNGDLSQYRTDATFRFRARDASAELRLLYNQIDSVMELAAIELDGRPVDRSLVRHVPEQSAFLIDGRAVGLTTGAHTLRVAGRALLRPPSDIVRFGNWHPHLQDWSRPLPISMEVRTSARFVAVGSGRLLSDSVIGGRRITRWQSIGPGYWMLLTVAPYRVHRVRRGSRELMIYSHSDLEAIDPERTGAEFFSVLEFLEAQIGPVGRDTFGLLVRDGLPNAMMDGVMTMSMDFYEQARQQPEKLRPLFGHELAHLWWGGLVKAREPGVLWLIESFAEYWRTVHDRARGADALPWWLRQRLVLSQARDAELPSLMQATYDHAAVPYQKGTHVLHMLEAEIGTDALTRVFQLHFERAKNGYATIARFAEIVNEVTGSDYGWFFEQWLERAEGPSLALDSVSLTESASGIAVSGTVTQTGPTYRLQLPLEVRLADGRTVIENVRAEGASTPFSFEYNGRPVELVLDPEYHVFRWSDPAALPLSFDEAWSILERDSAVVIETHGDWSRPDARSAFHSLLRERVPGIRILASESGAGFSRIILGAADTDGGACGAQTGRGPLDRWAWVRPAGAESRQFIMGLGGTPAAWRLMNGVEPLLPHNDYMMIHYAADAPRKAVPALQPICIRPSAADRDRIRTVRLGKRVRHQHQPFR